MLAITDAISDDGRSTASSALAVFQALCRDGRERWTVRLGGHLFDVVYVPSRAQVVRVLAATEQ